MEGALLYKILSIYRFISTTFQQDYLFQQDLFQQRFQQHCRPSRLGHSWFLEQASKYSFY